MRHLLLSFCLSLLLFVSCSTSDESSFSTPESSSSPSIVFDIMVIRGEITELSELGFLMEEDGERGPINVTVNRETLFDNNGNHIELEDLKIGDRVEVECREIATSYPRITSAIKTTVITPG